MSLIVATLQVKASGLHPWGSVGRWAVGVPELPEPPGLSYLSCLSYLSYLTVRWKVLRGTGYGTLDERSRPNHVDAQESASIQLVPYPLPYCLR